MSSQSVFQPGQRLASITGPETNGDAYVIRVGGWTHQARSIEIVMIPGPVQDYPVARCVMNSGKVRIVNLIHVQEVELMQEQEQQEQAA